MTGRGPIAGFAEQLRALKEQCGSPPVRVIAKKGNISPASVSAALAGAKRASWEIIRGVLQGLEVPLEELAGWEAGWARADQAQARYQPELRCCRTRESVLAAFLDLLAAVDRDLEQVAAGIASVDHDRVEKFLLTPPPSAADLDGVFRARTRPLTADILGWAVYGAGGTSGDVDYWRRHLARVIASQNIPVVDATAGGVPVVPAPRTSPESLDPAGAAPLDVQTAASVTSDPVRAAVDQDGHAGGDHRRKHPVRWMPVAAAVLVVLVALLLDPVRHGLSTPRAIGAAVTPAPEPLTDRRRPDPATRAELIQLAQRAGQSPSPAVGRYTYIHRLLYSQSDIPADPQGPQTVMDEQLWWNTTDTGLRLTTVTAPRSPPIRQREYPLANDLQLPMDAPSTDAAALMQQLALLHPDQAGPDRWLQAVCDMNDFYDLSPAQRAATLTVLATVDGISYAGPATDDLGRSGIAFSADNTEAATSTQRITLIFNNDTGELISQEVVTLSPNPADEHVISRIIYLERGRRDTTD